MTIQDVVDVASYLSSCLGFTTGLWFWKWCISVATDDRR